MTVVVRGVVELFLLIKRDKELHREILAILISHDHRALRIQGHYPIVGGGKSRVRRHAIREFGFTALDGKQKWTAYQFTKVVDNV
jgi:hypothetical protein